MKNYLFATTVVTAVMALSCASDDTTISEAGNVKMFKAKSLTDSVSSPSNPDNAFDTAGAIYTQLYDAYSALPNKPSDASGIVAETERLAKELGIISPSGYRPIVTTDLVALLNTTATNPQLALNRLELSATGKSELSGLITDLGVLKQAGEAYDAVYEKIAQREAAWNLSQALTVSDKQVLLVTASVLRYDTYNKSRRKRRDRDWELSVGNIIATADGAAFSVDNAIIMGVASDSMY